MKIISADFIKSAVKQSDYPEEVLPEVAFAGRSNVGKSSLINTVVNRKHLVRTSSSPGRTQTLNFFRINNQVQFVDFPGYGFAKVPLRIKAQWKSMVETYLKNRRTLKLVVLLLDIRRVPNTDDISLIRWLEAYGIPCLIVLTKTDKLKNNKCRSQEKVIRDALSLNNQEVISFSAVTGRGRKEALQHIIKTL